ncbi:hypothetical protein AB1Y20_015282 [Prymnesium parvum]|uniref:Uncharacterized protein n=1 Tax=Prymnesium parvum TaxID=97485 RepID=A0AB34JXC2_PRYPA
MVSASVSPRPPSPPVQATVIQVGAVGSCKKSTVGEDAPYSIPRCDDIEQLKFDNQIARSSSEQHARSSTGTPTGTRISAHHEHMSRKSAGASRSYCLAHTLSSASDASILRKKVDATVVRSSVKAIDHFGEKDPLPKSVVGGVSTILAVLLFVGFVVYRVISFTLEPNDMIITARWTIVDGPVTPGPLYPMLVECLAEQGCSVALRYSGESTFSSACVSASAQVPNPGSILLAGGLVQLVKSEVVLALVCYTDDPRDGLISWHNGTSPFGIAIESVAPINGVVTRVRVPVHEGRTLFKLVNTTDYTYPAGDIGELGGAWTVCLALVAVFYFLIMKGYRGDLCTSMKEIFFP